MPDEWDLSDAELDAWLEWEAVDRAAAEYLAERVSTVEDSLDDEDAAWVGQLAETISPSEEPEEHEIEAVSAVMALQHATGSGWRSASYVVGPALSSSPNTCWRTSSCLTTSRERSRTAKVS